MNLLIVDDKPARYDALIRRLRENQFAEGRIDLATSIGDALERLEDRRYEILVVDMMLPQASWGAELSDGGAQLLQHIEEGGHRLPTYIVGITAASEDSAGGKGRFRPRTVDPSSR
jgi:CheY-like chemotaxis protein